MKNRGRIAKVGLGCEELMLFASLNEFLSVNLVLGQRGRKGVCTVRARRIRYRNFVEMRMTFNQAPQQLICAKTRILHKQRKV